MAGPGCFTLCDGTAVRAGVPFFIVGSGRCGTTLMRRLIIERSQAVIPPENYILALTPRIAASAGTDWALLCRLLLTGMRLHSGNWEDFGLPQDTTVTLLGSVPELHRVPANFWHAFHALYARHLGRPSDTAWGDKTPANVDALAEIIRLFPQARFILMVRDVFDMAYSYGQTAAAGRAGQYLAGAKRWAEANAKALAFAGTYPGQTILVRYEDLALSPDREMARVLDHLSLPTCPDGRLSTPEAREIASVPDLRNALDPVSGASIGKGRVNLPGDMKERIAGIASSLQVCLGYEPSGALGPRPA